MVTLNYQRVSTIIVSERRDVSTWSSFGSARLREGIQRPLRGHGPPPQQALGRVQQHVAQGPRLPGKRERLGAGPCVGKSGKSVLDEIWEHRKSGKNMITVWETRRKIMGTYAKTSPIGTS